MSQLYDFNKVIKAAIASIPSANKVRICYGFPREWNNFPIVAYTSGTKVPEASEINLPATRRYTIQYYIDIWTQKELGTKYELELISALDHAGFHTSSLGDIVEDAEKDRHHIRLSATCLYDTKNNTLY